MQRAMARIMTLRQPTSGEDASGGKTPIAEVTTPLRCLGEEAQLQLVTDG